MALNKQQKRDYAKLLGVQGIDNARQEAGFSQAGYYGRQAVTRDQFKTDGVKTFNVDTTFGRTLAAAIGNLRDREAQARFIPEFLVGGQLAKTLRVSQVPESGDILLPFVTQVNDVGVASYSVPKDPETLQASTARKPSLRSWVPVGGPQWQDALVRLSETDRGEAENMVLAAAAIGLRSALLKDGVLSQDNRVVMPLRSLATVDETFKNFKNRLASQKGHLGAIRLAGAHPDLFQNPQAAFERYAQTGEASGLKFKNNGGFGTLAGQTAFPRRMPDGTIVSGDVRMGSAGCNAHGSGPGLTGDWRFQPAETKYGTEYCAVSPNVNPASSYRARQKYGAGMANGQAYMDSLAAQGVNAADLAAYGQKYKKPDGPSPFAGGLKKGEQPKFAQARAAELASHSWGNGAAPAPRSQAAGSGRAPAAGSSWSKRGPRISTASAIPVSSGQFGVLSGDEGDQQMLE
jgi:hypothetical protein